jgi:hypothetical protein
MLARIRELERRAGIERAAQPITRREYADDDASGVANRSPE